MEIEYDIRFTDRTINEADGSFSAVKKIMYQEMPSNDEKWVLRSDVTVVGPTGCGQMILQLQGDGKVFIIEYNPSIPDVFYNTDIPILTQWCQKKGWKVPEPTPDLIKLDKVFWKHFYDTLLVDSEYFDKRYGKREHLNPPE